MLLEENCKFVYQVLHYDNKFNNFRGKKERKKYRTVHLSYM